MSEDDNAYIRSQLDLSRTLTEAGDALSAIQILKIAVSSFPDVPIIYQYLGMSYIGASDFENAIKCFEKAIDLHSEYPDPWFNLGTIHEDEYSDYSNALRCYKKCIALSEGKLSQQALQRINNLADFM